MGTEEHHKKAFRHQVPTNAKVKILLLLITTNLTSIYLTSIYLSPTSSSSSSSTNDLLLSINSTQSQLYSLFQSLLLSQNTATTTSDEEEEQREQQPELPLEVRLAVGPHQLPFGFTPNIGSDSINLPIGSACQAYRDDLIQYMTYPAGGECPVDDVFAQQLMLKGCEPLPRRRCHPKTPLDYQEPDPLPESLWATPPDTSIIWDPYTCKNYDCLINRRKQPGTYDCKDCFNLEDREKVRWMDDTDSIDYGIDAVLRYKRPGTVRIGLDIGGGSGTFAARMRERNVTIVTTSMNFDGPFNSFIASRGLVPMHISISHRLPFFENTLDIVHSMHVLSNWIPDIMLEFALYDIYRVLRPGGLFWLDRFFCTGDQMNGTYVPMFGKIGFNRLRWNVARKLDKGFEKNEWYISALLEKPMS